MSSHLLIRPSHLFIRQESVRKSLETHVPGFLKARELCLFSCVNSHIYKKCNTHSLWVLAANEYLKSNLSSERIEELKNAYQFEKISVERLKKIATGCSVQMYSKVSFQKGVDKADRWVKSSLGRACLRKTVWAAPLIGCGAGFLTASLLSILFLNEKVHLPVSPSLILKAMAVSLAIQMVFSEEFPLNPRMIRQFSKTFIHAFSFSAAPTMFTLFTGAFVYIIFFCKRWVIAEINQRVSFEESEWPLGHAFYHILPGDESIQACILGVFVKNISLLFPPPIELSVLVPTHILGNISAVSMATARYLLWNKNLNHLDNKPQTMIPDFIGVPPLAAAAGIIAYIAASQAETVVPRVFRYNLSTLSIVADASPHLLHRAMTEVSRNKVSTAIDAVVVSVAIAALVGSGAASALTLGVSVACVLKCSGRAIVPRNIVRSIAWVGSKIATRVLSGFSDMFEQ